MKTLKQFLFCIYVNKFALLGYIIFPVSFYIAYLIKYPLLIFPGLGLLILTAGGYDTYCYYKEALGMGLRGLEKVEHVCNMDYCLRVAYHLALKELRNPKPS